MCFVPTTTPCVVGLWESAEPVLGSQHRSVPGSSTFQNPHPVSLPPFFWPVPPTCWLLPSLKELEASLSLCRLPILAIVGLSPSSPCNSHNDIPASFKRGRQTLPKHSHQSCLQGKVSLSLPLSSPHSIPSLSPPTLPCQQVHVLSDAQPPQSSPQPQSFCLLNCYRPPLEEVNPLPSSSWAKPGYSMQKGKLGRRT